jgi:hypothetical protein
MYDIIYISRYDIMYMHIPRLDTRIYTSLFSIDGALFLSNKHLVRGEEHLTGALANFVEKASQQTNGPDRPTVLLSKKFCMVYPDCYQTRSTIKINQTLSKLSSHLPPTRKMASSQKNQPKTTPDTLQQNNNSHEENSMLESKSLSCKEENVPFSNQPQAVAQSSSMNSAQEPVTPHDMEIKLYPSSSFIEIEESFPSSDPSMNSQGFDLKTDTSSNGQSLQLNPNVNNEQRSDESSYTLPHVPPSTTSFDQTYFLKLEIDRLTKELEHMKLQQSQQQLNTTRTSHPNTSYSFIHQPKTTMTQAPHSTVSTTPIHIIVNTDPLQQMKDFVKPFNGNPNDDVMKWIESIIHYFDIAQVPGDKETLYFQYAPAFLKEYAYKWWLDQKHYIFSWSVFQQALLTQFAEKNEYLIEQQLDQRKQQLNEPVIKYYYDIIDLCKKYDSNMSDKQKIRKLTNGLKLSLYQEAVKETYSTPFEFLFKVQQLENMQKLIELRRNQTTQVSTIIKNDDTLSSSQVHPYRSSNPHSSSSNRQPNNYSARSPYYPTSMQDDYSYKPSQLLSSSNRYPSNGHAESDQYQQHPVSQLSQSQQNYGQPHSSSSHQNYSSRKSDIYCFRCGQPGHISPNCNQQQQYSKNQ